MKKIKLFCFPSHGTEERTSGVDFARIIQPMKHLNGWSNKEYKIETYIFDPIKDKGLDWIKVVTDFDAIYFNYTANPWAFAAMGAMARKTGKPLIMDMDDNLWGVAPDNPAYNVYKKGSEGLANFTAIVNEVDYITCTSSYLRNVITKNSTKTHDYIKVFDNYIDLDLYKYPQEFKNDGTITLTHFGSTTHFIDLENRAFVEGLTKIMWEYPNVNFLTVGHFIPSFRNKWGQRYQNEFGHQDIYKWISDRFPEVMAKTDICVVPLEETIYTKCKSAIKWLEMSSAKKPGVWQRIRQYENVVDGTNGLLANTTNEWYEAIKKLIDDTELRRKMGEKAYEDVHNYKIQEKLNEYGEFFVDIIKNKS